MADIDIERRRRSPLPWIVLGVLVLAALAFLLMRGRDGDRAEDGRRVDTLTAPAAAP